jgi:hypothetical protein
MRRLISVLAAGLFAAGTAVTSAGVASAGVASAGATAAHDRVGCVNGNYFHVAKNGVNYYLGTPNTTSAGAAAILKPAQNGTTEWKECAFSTADNAIVLKNRGLVLTSTATSTGADVTMTPVKNGGKGLKSQRWIADAAGPMITFKNIKTGLYLRVRNNGPVMKQTVTTGTSFTVWLMF